MFEGGILTTALALVGFVPARETLRHEPNLALIPNDPVNRPTTTVSSPCPDLALMPAIPAMPVAQMPGMPAKVYSIDVSSVARIPDIHAIEFFIDEWIDLVGETVDSLDSLLRSYRDMRAEHSFLPPVSKKRLSQLLASNGSRRFTRDGRDSEGQRHRVIYFEMRMRKAATKQRRAA